MQARAHVHVYGRVQGVYYRQETLRQARAHGLSGWVRNNPNGSVEAVFDGEEPAVKEVVEWCSSGPPSARVERVEVAWESRTGGFEHFGII